MGKHKFSAIFEEDPHERLICEKRIGWLLHYKNIDFKSLKLTIMF